MFSEKTNPLSRSSAKQTEPYVKELAKVTEPRDAVGRTKKEERKAEERRLSSVFSIE
jgi:hypothetical protein